MRPTCTSPHTAWGAVVGPPPQSAEGEDHEHCDDGQCGHQNAPISGNQQIPGDLQIGYQA